jgi:hypothetical protein
LAEFPLSTTLSNSSISIDRGELGMPDAKDRGSVSFSLNIKEDSPMKGHKTLIRTVAFSFTLAAAVPAFAQRGIGVGVGSQTGVSVGRGAGVNTQTGVGVQAGGAKVGVGADADVKAQRPASRIESNPELASRVQSMLPSGSSIASASSGFKNEGQFLAALHASQNLNIPFDQLKAKMTGASAVSLGSAIKAAKPEMSENQAREEAKKAETEAKASASLKATASAGGARKQ